MSGTRQLLRLAALAALAAAAGAPARLPSAAAAVPAGPPVFTTPLEVSNVLHPFQPGAVKVYSGREGRDAVVVVERHLAETRSFVWDAAAVECCVVETLKFVRGRSASRERFFVAQADDGSVWAFGEIDDRDPVDDAGEDADESGGWIVGQAAPGDPENLTTGATPALLMPAAPARGDEWEPEDAPPDFVKTGRVTDDSAVVRAAGARLRNCIRIVERDHVDETSEVRLYAPGIGLVQTREPGERLSLTASTLRGTR